MTKKSYEIDMCNGPLLSKIFLFSIPLMLSGILQLLFNAVDIIVVGRYVGNEALAAVGSTSSLINLLTNVFVGLSVGCNVLIARHFAAKESKEVSETVHTAILLSLICGTILCVMGIFLAKPLLNLMGTPSDVLNQSALYMKIYFSGMPVMMLYNFGSSILRAIGDTKRPLYFLAIAGLVNVILNLCFVLIFKMAVAGVALATVLSQCISALLIVRCLRHQDNSCRLKLSQLYLHKDKFLKIIQIGLPAGIQGAIFSMSNVLIQSSVNSFGSMAMAGNTTSANIEGFIYTSMNAFHQTALSFTSQNLGAKKYERVSKILIICLILVSITGLSMGLTTLCFGEHLLGMYTSNPQVIQYGLSRMQVICVSYFTCGLMDVMVGALRGLGYSVMPMIVSLLGACGLRILWVFTIFVWHRSLFILYMSYPISWIITFSIHVLCYFIIRKKVIPSLATCPIS